MIKYLKSALFSHSSFLLIFLCCVGVVYSQPKASFYATPVQGCNPLKVDFTNTSTGATTYLWKFGNGNESTIASPGAVYNVSGKFSITLIAIDSKGKSDTVVFKNYITVFKSPVAKMGADKTLVCLGDSIVFIDKSIKGDAPINQYQWDFGDGGTSSKPGPGYTYALSGVFDVTYAVMDTNGCKSSIRTNRMVGVNPPPKVDFTSNQTSKCKAPLDVALTSVVSGASPFQYSWIFGDSTTSIAANPNHTYASLGTYNLSLAVTDANGCISTAVKPGLIKINPPVADFSTTTIDACVGTKVFFNNLCQPGNSGGTYSWDFGNGNTSTDVAGETVYTKTGNYDVSLTFNWDNCTSVLKKPAVIVVHELPTGNITPRDTIVCRDRVSFLNYRFNGKNATYVNWSFNNQPSIAQFADSVYRFPLANNGSYSIHATAISPFGCKTVLDSVKVLVRGPMANMKVDSFEGCIPYNLNAKWTGQSAAKITRFTWTAADGTTGSDSTFAMMNKKFGESILLLKVLDENGCSDLTSKTLKAGIHVKLDFITVPKVCRKAFFTIHNNSNYLSKDTVLFKYQWHGGDSLKWQGKDSMRMKLMDSAGTIGNFSFTANSFGCFSSLPKDKEPKVLIMGPEVKGLVNTICEGDSLSGFNQSTRFTRSFWRFNDATNTEKIDAAIKLSRKLSETSKLWLFAYNDTNHCQDSLEYKLSIDPQPVSFTYSVSCATHVLNASNGYVGLPDSLLTWELTHIPSGTKQIFHSRTLVQWLTKTGKYSLKLSAGNPKYDCTRPHTAFFTVDPEPGIPPTVVMDRSTCYPVKITLNDPDHKLWNNALWKVGRKLTLLDTASPISFVYSDNLDDLNIYLIKTDSGGCLRNDTFAYKIGGGKAVIVSNQTDITCVKSEIRFEGFIANSVKGAKYTYNWDFGTKTSNKQSDSLQIFGWKQFTVKLTVNDNLGCSSTLEMPFDVKNASPKAKFEVSDTTPACPPMNVVFTDVSQGGKSPIAKRVWNFGDSTYSTKPQPGKLYIYPGKYSVSLAVQNGLGCSDTLRIPDLIVVNGPTGTYFIDKLFGCTPLNVNLTTKIKGKIYKLEFDMGDGAVLDIKGNSHKYMRPGEYIPRLIVTDSNACRYSPEPKDTIHVYPNPIANFDNGKVCNKGQYDLLNKSDMQGDSLQSTRWTFNTISQYGNTPFHVQFGPQKTENVSLWVSSMHGCADSVTKPFKVYGIYPALVSDKGQYCLGELVRIDNKSNSDTPITNTAIWLNGVLQPNTNPVFAAADARGKIPAFLKITDKMGCTDTFSINTFIKVGDTLPPSVLNIYRTTVVDNFTTQTKFTTSREPDFDYYKLDVFTNGQWVTKSKSWNVNDTDLFADGLNTLNQSYCHRLIQTNYCGVGTDTVKLVPHCTIETKAMGDTNASHVWWSPYSGWKQVSKYRIWRKKKDETIFVLLDSVPGNQLSYIDSAITCHILYDYKIEGFEANGHFENSFSDTARAKPIHYLPVPAPEVWRTTVDSNQFTHTEWLMVKKPKMPISYYTLWKDDGTGWAVLNGVLDSLTFKQNDYNTRVQLQNYSYAVQATDVCKTTSAMSNVGRSVLLKVKQNVTTLDPVLYWTPYIYWNEGVSKYAIERSIGGGAFMEIGRVEGKVLEYTDVTLPKTCEKDFVYRVTALRHQPFNYPDSSHYVISVSNYSDFVPQIKFFIPNAFTPDGNNLNEGFAPNGVYFYKYNMKIYNRYGQKLYENDACKNAWNGRYDGKEAPDGVYAYAIEAWDLAGKMYRFSGTVHLMR